MRQTKQQNKNQTTNIRGGVADFGRHENLGEGRGGGGRKPHPQSSPGVFKHQDLGAPASNQIVLWLGFECVHVCVYEIPTT